MKQKLLAGSVAVAMLVVAGALWQLRSIERGDPAAADSTARADQENGATLAADARVDSSSPVAREATAESPALAAGELPANSSEALNATGRWIGRAVDERRMPVESAALELRVAGEPSWSGATSSDGGFVIPLRTPREALAGKRVALFVRSPDGAVAMRNCPLPGREPPRGYAAPTADDGPPTVDLGVLVLQASCSLTVNVMQSGVPARGARVEALGSGVSPIVLARATADSNGAAKFDSLPPGLLRVSATLEELAGISSAFLPHDESLSLELAPTQSYDVEVVDALSGAPVPGAWILISEALAVAASFDTDPMSRQEYTTLVALEREPLVTDENGRARVERLPSNGRFQIAVEADGYRSRPDPYDRRNGAVSLSSKESITRVALRQLGGRTVRWPIAAGEVPAPPEGASIALRWAPGAGFGREGLALPPGRIQDGKLVVDALETDGGLLATAPDGALAQAWIDPKSADGEAIAFRRPRTVEVTVRDAGGAAVPGVAVIARNQGNNPLCDYVRTDGEGRAELTGLYGELADVFVQPPNARLSAFRAGSVNLEHGDARLEVSLPSTFLARVRVLIGGAPQLPSRLRCAPLALEELPERGELRFELAAPSQGELASVVIAAVGYSPASVKIATPADGSEALAEVELTPAGELWIELRRDPAQQVEVLVERFDEKSGAWGPDRELGMFNGLRSPNGPGGGFRVAGLRAGRWRALDKRTGVASNDAELLAGVLQARVVLDLANVQWVTGRVEVPAGESVTSAVVLVDGLDSHSDLRRELPGAAAPSGARVSADGAFKLQIPGDREVTLRPWHPWLAPAEGSVVSTRTGLTGVTLKLAAGRELRIPTANLTDARVKQLRVGAWSSGSGASPKQWSFAPIVDSFARTADLAPGRWNLWIDAGPRFAPVELRDVEIGGGVTTLASLELHSGASVRVRVRANAGESAPRIYVVVSSNAEPKYWRDVNSQGESEVLVSGLGAGQFAVRISSIMDLREAKHFDVELDGDSEVVLDFAP